MVLPGSMHSTLNSQPHPLCPHHFPTTHHPHPHPLPVLVTLPCVACMVVGTYRLDFQSGTTHRIILCVYFWLFLLGSIHTPQHLPALPPRFTVAAHTPSRKRRTDTTTLLPPFTPLLQAPYPQQLKFPHLCCAPYAPLPRPYTANTAFSLFRQAYYMAYLRCVFCHAFSPAAGGRKCAVPLCLPSGGFSCTPFYPFYTHLFTHVVGTWFTFYLFSYHSLYIPYTTYTTL